VTTATHSRITVPHGLTFYDHQTELLEAYQGGARRIIANHHRQSGKSLFALGFTVMQAVQKPGTYLIASPTSQLCRENYWDARNPTTGDRYLDVIPRELVVETNENEMSIVVQTRQAGKTSRIVFRSADDPDRLRGPAYVGAVLDEFATMSSAEPLDIIRVPIEKSNGWLLIISTPNGIANHFYQVWRNAQDAGGWVLSTKTIRDTHDHAGRPLIPLTHVEQLRREGQREEWIQQEFFAAFAASLVSAYYGDQLSKAEEEGRITELPTRADVATMVAFDLGVRDATAVVYVQAIGEWLHLVDCDSYEGLAIPEIISRVRHKGWSLDRRWFLPHDAHVRELSASDSAGYAKTRADIMRELGVSPLVVPRAPSVQDNVDAVRRMFSRFKIDRRRCQPLLAALSQFVRQYDPKTKSFLPRPAHTPASHYADALATFARGYRERGGRSDDNPRAPFRHITWTHEGFWGHARPGSI
jgi:hypothetical protein